MEGNAVPVDKEGKTDKEPGDRAVRSTANLWDGPVTSHDLKGVLLPLQRRLTIFFVVIVIIPLTVAGFVVQRIVAGEISKRTELSLPGAPSVRW